MPTINEISNAAGYVGNAQLGGANTGSFQIDVRPIQQLAQYTYLYNKSLFDQAQKDADQKIEELAKLTAYDLSNARGKDKDAGIKALADLQKFGAEFAAKGTPKTPEEKIKQQIEYQNKIQGAEKVINSINARGIGYVARKNAILASNADAGLKDTQLKQLDEEFDNSDIYTKISAQPNFDLSVPKVGAPIIKKTGVLVETPNGVVDQTLGFFDPKSNLNAAYLEANNLELPVLPPNATALEKQEYEQKLKVKSTNKIWQDAAIVYNTALADPKYKLALPNNDPNNPVGDIDYNAIEADNPILHNTLQLIDRYNTYATERKADAAAGFYTDKLGNKVQLLQTVKPEDFFIIDKSKPLSPAQVVFLEKFADAAPDTKDEKFQYTGDAIKMQIERMQQAGQNYRAKLNEDGANYRASLGKGSGASTPIVDEAVAFTKKLLGKIEAATDANGKVDLIKAQLTPLEWQMMGTGSLVDGKFTIDGIDAKNSGLRFDKNTGTVMIDAPTAAGSTGFGGTPIINIDFAQIANNKYNSNAITETGKPENMNRQQLIQGYTTKVANPQPSNTSAQITGTDVFIINGKNYTKKQLNDIGYGDDKIVEAISLGTVKKGKK